MAFARTSTRQACPAVALVLMFSFALVASGLCARPAVARKARAKAKAAEATIIPIQAACTAMPAALATVRSARRPVKLGTVVYSLGTFKESYDVFVSPAGSGMSWTASGPGGSEAGSIPAGAFSGLTAGHLRLAVDTVGANGPRAPKGERRVALFSHFAPECQTVLFISPQPAPTTPVHTLAKIKGNTKLGSGSSGGGSHGAAVNWPTGPKAYAKLVAAHKRSKKALGVYLANPATKDGQNFEGNVIGSCRVSECLSKLDRVKLEPTKSKEEQAIAAKYGITTYPAFFLLPVGSEQAIVVVPEKQKAKGKKDDGVQPCHFADLVEKALKTKK